MASYVKDPAEKKDYRVDWSTHLAGDTIGSSAWAISPTGGLAQTTPAPSNTTTTTTIWLNAGAVDTDYTVTNTVNTAGGRILERSFEIKIRNL